jgi:2-polyprenyl-3-methyl-5-hydroxy-6-metoxy-1,4-benzoquinol methylase
MTTVLCPLTGSPNVALEKEIRCDWLIANYQQQLNINVSRYFLGLETIQIYKCLDTGYRFYYPFHIDGDGAFYESLQKFDWYYMDWKWEHQIASEMIKPSDKVLEIGCARGGFLNRLRQIGIEGVGLELNRSAAEAARARGLNVLDQSIQDHAHQHSAEYDVVCSFQVVEHIADIGSFIQASLESLKKGGTMVVSVPNNESLVIACYPHYVANMPPHHMGLWDMKSMINLSKVFSMELVNIVLEPLQPYHRGFANDVVLTERAERLSHKYGVVGRFYHRQTKGLISLTTSQLSKYIIGHTILGQYVKK